ncbi:aminotransferase class III-fold pyridoxal phosphate-dependent enzyme [Sinorhizobium meliloti]|nr:aminotransferase class III-fold pyridoxal phosphate-dependent enzyme [Sinorhizobium meliloti]MDW9850794.1 aminotransferase class III-fold pyridoxal phosphate-dependent enzyme [Sinorhizobium meliloti]MDX0147591.1 aminotransferase class III-fold pyridoxal phosphate-dependent enzyme [Sinorhizobium meliloti]MDX0153953.1 aminotransferase class III-fold pyridoxal phosphate-dependent enzyme [Sinorhizobium meliloti]MDX0172785.1 aminotransferase class III-fold pyridoxal phosphate-dependent enzyme [Si
MSTENGSSNSLAAADIATGLHPYTNARLHETKGPLIMDRGEGIYVYDINGRQYIESFAGLWSVAIGFSEPRLVEAAAKQMQKLPFYHTFNHMSHEPNIRLAEKLVEISPEQITRVSFTNSGSEANDTVVKMVWYVNNARGKPEKKKFLARTKGYHGITMASGSLTGLPNNHRDFDLPIIPVIHLTTPHLRTSGQEGETEAEFTARLLKEIEDTIISEEPETIAAFIGEPLMAAAGVLVPPAGYWQGVEALCRKYDLFLVADEVVNGFGRLGTMFGSTYFGFKPDIMVTSKQLTSSYMPLAAILFTDEIYNVLADNTAKIGTWGHGYTTTGHPVATAVALENLNIIEERDLVGNSARVGKVFMEELQKLNDHPMVGDVRGVGLMAAVEMVPEKFSRKGFEQFGRAGGKAFASALRNNLIVRVVGDQLIFCPPLIITEEQALEVASRTKRTLDEVAAFVASEGIK